jgi:hypothetical protein
MQEVSLNKMGRVLRAFQNGLDLGLCDRGYDAVILRPDGCTLTLSMKNFQRMVRIGANIPIEDVPRVLVDDRIPAAYSDLRAHRYSEYEYWNTVRSYRIIAAAVMKARLEGTWERPQKK